MFDNDLYGFLWFTDFMLWKRRYEGWLGEGGLSYFAKKNVYSLYESFVIMTRLNGHTVKSYIGSSRRIASSSKQAVSKKRADIFVFYGLCTFLNWNGKTFHNCAARAAIPLENFAQFVHFQITKAISLKIIGGNKRFPQSWQNPFRRGQRISARRGRDF